ncbi:MAG TPA: glycosyl hydrolase, partial [Fimbriimonas sp.]
WAWNSDRPWPGVEAYYPGHETVDLLGADIYPLPNRPEVYPQEWYDRVEKLAEGRPVALSEMSVLPTSSLLEKQPWAYFMSWDNLVFRANEDDRIREVFASVRVVSDRVP